MFRRLDGEPVGRNGIKSVSTQVLLTAGQSFYWPRNEKRVALLISNMGDAAGLPGWSLNVKPVEDLAASMGFTGTNGHILGYLGSLQIDEHFPWVDALFITGILSNTYVCITEIFDAG